MRRQASGGATMRQRVLSLALLAITLALTLPAQAQNGTLTRSFVSSGGLDTNSCMITAPCASFAEAYTKVGANGIIAALDPGKYGPITITGPVTINGNGWAAITGTAQGNGITINAVSGNVALIGLEIDGAAAAYNGIVFNSGSTLTVTNCIVQNFVQDGSTHVYTGNGILLQPTTGTLNFAITGTTVSNNAFVGLYYLPPSGSPTAHGAIDRVTATGNSDGITIAPINATGGTTSVTVSNSIASNNNGSGIGAGNVSAPMKLAIHNVTAGGNGAYGILAIGTPQVLLGRSVIKGNQAAGILNDTNPNTFYTYGNNQINLNGANLATDVSGSGSPLNTTFSTR
jgi:hypothetical protein